MHQNGKLNFNHAEPRGMFGGVLKLQLTLNSPRLNRWESRIEGSGRVGIEIVQHAPDLLDVREMDIDQLAHTLGKIGRGALRDHFGMTPTGIWL